MNRIAVTDACYRARGRPADACAIRTQTAPCTMSNRFAMPARGSFRAAGRWRANAAKRRRDAYIALLPATSVAAVNILFAQYDALCAVRNQAHKDHHTQLLKDRRTAEIPND